MTHEKQELQVFFLLVVVAGFLPGLAVFLWDVFANWEWSSISLYLENVVMFYVWQIELLALTLLCLWIAIGWATAEKKRIAVTTILVAHTFLGFLLIQARGMGGLRSIFESAFYDL